MPYLISEEVKVFRIKCLCECGGEFKHTGLVLYTNPPVYPHVCNKCFVEKTLEAQYPKLEYLTNVERAKYSEPVEDKTQTEKIQETQG